MDEKVSKPSETDKPTGNIFGEINDAAKSSGIDVDKIKQAARERTEIEHAGETARNISNVLRHLPDAIRQTQLACYKTILHPTVFAELEQQMKDDK